MTLGISSATFPAVLQMGGVKTCARFPSSKYFKGSGTGRDSQGLQCTVLDLKQESRCKFNSFFSSIRLLCAFVFHGVTATSHFFFFTISCKYSRTVAMTLFSLSTLCFKGKICPAPPINCLNCLVNVTLAIFFEVIFQGRILKAKQF